MLNHGVADDNVHYQHSMLLTRALEQADIQFVQHSYPDENHSLGGVSRYIQQVVNLVLTLLLVIRFLYHAMDQFWEDCFEIDESSQPSSSASVNSIQYASFFSFITILCV